GGYVQLNYKVDDRWGTWFPFTRWQYYDGGRKFARNAPAMDVNELDFGVEWQPIPDLEVTVAYTHTFTRTNTRTAPYAATENADRVGFQLQWNY
ncbi:MAG: porin, partial [Verrucomicrobiota bacterium]